MTATELFKKADALAAQAKFQAVIALCEQAMPTFKEQKVWADYFECFNQIGRSYGQSGHYAKGISILKKALVEVEELLPIASTFVFVLFVLIDD